MPDIIVQDIDPRNQYTAGGGLPTVFAFTFPIFALTDIVVYQTLVGQAPNDVTQVLTYNVDYTVTNNIPPAVGGTITLTTGSPAGDIITIVRDLPDNRLNNYVDGGLFQATDVNTDFDRCVMMNQQNKLYKAVPGSIGVGYNNSAVITPIVDNILPLLPANCVWQMNSTHTQIQAVLFNAGQGGGGAVLPSVVNHFATFSNTTGTIKDSGFRAPLVDGNANDVMITDGAFNTSFTNVVNVLPASISGINRLINGDFQVWQRGAGGTASFAVAGGANAYTADRWQMLSGAATNMTVSQQPGATSGSFYARIQRDAAGAGLAAPAFGQSLPRGSCIGSASNNLTISFKALKGANFSAAGDILTVNVFTGTGATDISQITTGFVGATAVIQTNVVLTANLQSFSVTTVAPVGATVTQLCVYFSYVPVGVAGANDWFEVTDVQLEVGASATQFQRFSFSEQINKCLSYYRKTFIYPTLPAQNIGTINGEYLFASTIAGAFSNVLPPIILEPPMFAIPTITYFNPAAANALIRDILNGVDFTTTSTQDIQQGSVSIGGIGNGITPSGTLCGIHYTLEAELT